MILTLPIQTIKNKLNLFSSLIKGTNNLGHIMLGFKDDALFFHGGQASTQLTVKVMDLPNVQADTFGIPYTSFKNKINSLPQEGDITLDIDLKTFTCIMKYKRIKMTLPLLAKNQYPFIKARTYSNVYEYDGEVFKDTVGKLVKFIPSNNIRNEINGLYLDKNYICATDLHILSAINMQDKTDVKQDNQSSTIIPKHTLKECLNILKEKGLSLTLSFEYNQVLFRFSNGIKLISAVYIGKFPPFERILNTTSQDRFSLDKHELLTLLNAAKASYPSDKINLANQVNIPLEAEYNNQTLTLNYPNVYQGEMGYSGTVLSDKQKISLDYLLKSIMTLENETIEVDSDNKTSLKLFDTNGCFIAIANMN